MNILIDIAHPAHVHLVKNAYFELLRKGHKVIVTVKDIPSAIQLLKLAQIPYIYIGGKRDSLFGKAFLQLGYYLKILKIIIQEKIQIGFASSITLPHLARITGMKSIVLDDDDDEVEPLFAKYAHPFADVVLSPDCLTRKTSKLLTYPGYHELAYLHPKRFTPDITVLNEIGVKPGEPYFILRFNAFKAHHDVNVQGLSIENKRKLITLLSSRGKVFITTERNIDDEFKTYQLSISQDKVHSLIFYATMLVGDSQTMTSEAAVLGVPSIRCNTFAGRISYLEEEEHKYGLTYGFHPDDASGMFIKIDELLAIPDLKSVWNAKRERLLKDKIDVTAFFVWFLENYPESSKEINQMNMNRFK